MPERTGDRRADLLGVDKDGSEWYQVSIGGTPVTATNAADGSGQWIELAIGNAANLHVLSTVMHADRIHVLERGRIVLSGGEALMPVRIRCARGPRVEYLLHLDHPAGRGDPPPGPPPFVPGAEMLANISTRTNVGTGENQLIGGFIVTGTKAKQVVLRAIGPRMARDLFLTGDRFDAKEAHRIGLVNRVVDEGQALEAARARMAKEEQSRKALADGQLGLDLYGLRDKLAARGVRYVSAGDQDSR